jgi:hypothetical protein
MGISSDNNWCALIYWGRIKRFLLDFLGVGKLIGIIADAL